MLDLSPLSTEATNIVVDKIFSSYMDYVANASLDNIQILNSAKKVRETKTALCMLQMKNLQIQCISFQTREKQKYRL